MKDKNNKTTNELVDLIIEVKKKQGQEAVAYAHATGVLIAIMEWARKCSNKSALQKEIDNNFFYYEQELKNLSTPLPSATA